MQSLTTYSLSFLMCVLSAIAGDLFAQTANTNQGCVPLTVQFTGPTGSGNYYWDFQDGASSNLQNPSNTFTTAGTYNVQLYDGVNGPLIGTVAISVFDKPVPSILTSSELKGCAPLTVDLTADVVLPGSITASSYNWTFGQGSGGASQNVIFTYTQEGVYTVSIEILTSEPSCDNTTSFPNFVSVSNPLPNFITNPSPAVACTAPFNVAFLETSFSNLPLTYAWDMGNGNTYTDENPPNQTYNSPGDYTVTLTITDTNNCVKSVDKLVSIGQPLSDFDVPDTICLNTSVQLTNNSTPGTPAWLIDGATFPGSSQNEPTIFLNTVGTHTINLTTTSANGQCSHDTTKTVVVEDTSFQVNAIPTPQCDPNGMFTYSVVPNNYVVDYAWTFQNGQTSNMPNPTIQYEFPDTTYARRGSYPVVGIVEVTTSNGCVTSRFFSDTIFLVFARMMPDVVDGCAPLEVVFSDSSISEFDIVTYQYDYGDGTTSTFNSDAPHSHTFTAPGRYPVVLTATNNMGCTDVSDTIWIEVGEELVYDFNASPIDICPGDSVDLDLIPFPDEVKVDAWNFSSDGEKLSACFDNANGKFAFNDSVGSFDVTLTAIYNGCATKVTKSDLIEVKGPLAKMNWTYECEDTVEYFFDNQSMSATSTSWDFGNGQTSSTGADTLFRYDSTGDYWVYLTAENDTSGCPVSVDSSWVHVRRIEAQFDGPSLICGGVPVAFDGLSSTDVHTDCGRGYKWIYSDPNIRPITTDQNSSDLTFIESGDQNISLVVTDINGCTDTLEKQVRVFNVDAFYDLPDTNICLPDTMLFEDLSTSDTTLSTWQWVFGDGGSSSSQDTVYHYTVPMDTLETYLIVTDVLGCESQYSFDVIQYQIQSNLTTDPFPIYSCAGAPIQFSADDFTDEGSYLIVDWDFDDGNFDSGLTTTHAYSDSGTYDVKMTFTEAVSGCVDSLQTFAYIQTPPVVNIEMDTDVLPALCSPQLINFEANYQSDFQVTLVDWDFSDGSSSQIINPAFVFENGIHTAQVVVSTSFGCSDTAVREFEVIGPTGDFTLDTNLICLGDPILFTLVDTSDVAGFYWDFGDGTGAIDTTPIVHHYYFLPPSGQTVAKLTVYGANGVCPQTIEKEVLIREVRAEFQRNDGLDTVLCLGEPLNLTNTSLNSDVFSWQFGDGAVSGVSQTNFVHNYTYSDTFELTLDVLNTEFGCRDTISKIVIVHDLPVFNLYGDTVCFEEVGQIGILDPQTTYVYEWSPSLGLSSINDETPVVNVGATTEYTLEVTDTVKNCSDTRSVDFVVIPPLEDIYFDTVIVIGDSIQLPIDNENGFLVFTWNPDTGLSCLQCSNPIHQGLEDIVYEVLIEDTLGCSFAQGVFDIKIQPEILIEVPTTFTPNGDGVNDIIYLEGWGIREVEYFQIFNRWGELVFESQNLDHGWDGYYKGVLQNNDTYTYKAKVKTWRNTEIEGAGHINLMR